MATKKSRFESLTVVNAPSSNEPKATEPAPAVEPRVMFSLQIRPDLRAAIKSASALERRKMYEIVEELLEGYLEENHPQLLNK
mgnify:CR=1 FL=1